MSDYVKVKMFRSVTDLSIDVKARKAHMIRDLPGWEAWFHLPTGSVHVKTGAGRFGIVGIGNLEFIELEDGNYGPFQDKTGEGEETKEQEKRRPGRPKLEAG